MVRPPSSASPSRPAAAPRWKDCWKRICAVFPLNPKAAERFRDRKAPAGGKTDRFDAFCFADALRTDGHGWRPLRPQDPLTQELRLLCRDEVTLIEQRTALVNQLQAALHEYYPTAIAAFDDWTKGGAWEFILAFPTPHHLASAGKRKWEKFLHAHKLYRPETAAKRIELFATAAQVGQSQLPPSPRPRACWPSPAPSNCVLLEGQLDEYRHRINELFGKHPDHDLFGSLPGAGEKLAPRLLAEIGADPRGLRGSRGVAVLCWGRAGHPAVRPQSIRDHTPGLQHAPARDDPSVGRPEQDQNAPGPRRITSRNASRG